MDNVFVAWGRGIACVLTLACLAACNDDSTNSADGGQYSPPAAVNPPVGSNPPPDSDPPSTDPTPPPSGNVSPHIGGSPGTEVLVGQAYEFTPNASDANDDNLSFSIASKPSWASFDASTGRLSGTPAAGDVGSHEDIAISVTDGASTEALPQFAINVVQQGNGSVTLAWQAPTENTDGSPLVDLAGYKIHYGTQPGDYSSTITLNNGGLTRYVVENLTSGTYYFAITAVSGNGTESDLSGEANKTI